MSFFGRTYLLSTVKVPPFPAKAPPVGATTIRPANGAAVSGQGRQEEEGEEEERVFEWMRGALNGPGALGSTGFFPGAGAPIVLDLGAVAQVRRCFEVQQLSTYRESARRSILRRFLQHSVREGGSTAAGWYT